MNVAQLMEKVKARQGEMSNERYARNFDVSGTTLFRWHKGERQPDLYAVRAMARYYTAQKDKEMIRALTSYALFGGDNSS